MSAPPQAWLRLDRNYFTVELNVRPGAGQRRFLPIRPTGPVVAVSSPPERGRANRELLEFIAAVLEVPIASVSIIKGQGARRKVIRVAASLPAVLAAKLIDAANRA